jgi:NAD(P)-dependent dehydrogenase (short-subunit alcohol dehydrogenase family)
MSQATSERVAIVTGGTRGIGAAITERLNADGVRVVAAFRSDATSAKALADRLVTPELLSTYQVDVTDQVACAQMIDNVVADHGRIDYLINNAGALAERPVKEITSTDWDMTLTLNLSAAFYLSQAVLDPMRAQKFGRIVNIGSASAFMGSAFQIDYAAAKAGMVGLTRSLARAVARRGITVNCVVPGGFETDLLKDMTMTDGGLVKGMIPVGRYGHPHELAHIVASLVHYDASYVTGAVIVVDGGLTMGS